MLDMWVYSLLPLVYVQIMQSTSVNLFANEYVCTCAKLQHHGNLTFLMANQEVHNFGTNNRQALAICNKTLSKILWPICALLFIYFINYKGDEYRFS